MFETFRFYLMSYGLDRRGASALEYVLLTAVLGIAVIAAVNFVSTEIGNLNREVAEAIE